MKFLLALMLCASTLHAFEDDFSKDKLIISAENISVISSFEAMTFITTYSSTGEPLWEAPFTSEIISCKCAEDHLLVFSKARNGIAYFLTCIEAKNGTMVWERPIMAPRFDE